MLCRAAFEQAKEGKTEDVKGGLDAKVADLLKSARRVIIVPGYGMALAQAQYKVKQLADALAANGARVDFAVHPAAGRSPGHMHVLLADAGIDYNRLLDVDTVNPLFSKADLAVVIGANDVINPELSGKVYGMPVLEVDRAANLIICNLDEKPGFSGVENPLYKRDDSILLPGDAAITTGHLVDLLTGYVRLQK